MRLLWSLVAAAFCGALAATSASGLLTPAGGRLAASGRVVVGPGIAEDTVRQVIRTAHDVVYVFAPDDSAQRSGSGPGVIRAYMGRNPGIPGAFSEVAET